MSRRFSVSQNEFIKLGDGTEYIRKFEVVGLKWKQFVVGDEETLGWCLHVYFSDAPSSKFFGEDARMIMKAFDLPEDPPQPPT